ncbi:MAG: hypothetical protein WB676_16205 [Bryobacteraceae bacterium]
MKRIGRIIIALSAFALVAAAADNTLGTWKYDTARSHPAVGHRPYNSLSITRESTDDGVKQTVQVENANGEKGQGAFTVKYDGKPVVVDGTLSFDTVAENQIDANTVSEEISKQGGKFHATRRYAVSADGKTTTITTSGTNAEGRPFTQVSVFDRQ